MEGKRGAARFVHGKTLSSDRFLDVFPHSGPETAVSASGEELNEDDFFWSGDFAENNHSSTPNSTAATRNYKHHQAKGFGGAENFGILAALPVVEADEYLQTRSVFNHKAVVSSSSSLSSTSSTRMIPRKPPLDRQGSFNFNQSAPVNVPVLPAAMRRNRAIHEFDDITDDDNEGGGGIQPPHEIVASRNSPMVACSVLEGVGRTLKGRDLRQVRNAVWRRTGFLD